MADSTWNPLEIPIMEAIAELERKMDDPDRMTVQHVASRVGMQVLAVARCLSVLVSEGYVSVVDTGNLDGDFICIRLQGPGKRAIGQWPGDGGQALLLAVMQMTDREPDPAKKSNLERVQDVLTSVTGDVLAQLAIRASHLG
jgi:hypothetical protein